jgi:GT2 family glycosyltransferase
VKVGIIVLNWNNYQDTKKCIDSICSIYKNDFVDIEIFLVDNKSTDGSDIKLRNEFSEKVNYYNSGYNGGYTFGNNFGIKKAIDFNCDYVLVLNNDLEILNLNAMLESAINIFDDNSEIGILGFDIYNVSTYELIISETKVDKVFNYFLGISTQKQYYTENVSFSNKRSVCGCAIMFRPSLLKSLGLFDERFFMYAEEQDICLRAIKDGWRVCEISHDDVKILRKVDSISSEQLIWYYGTRNIFLAYRKSLSLFHIFIFSIIQIAIYLRLGIYFIFKGQWKISIKILRGFFASMMGNYGKLNEK